MVYPGLNKHSFGMAFMITWLWFVLLSGCTESKDQAFERLNRQGIDHYARREYPSAITFWQAAHELNSLDESVLISMGTAYLKLASIPQAIECFEKAKRLFPDRVDIRYELVRLLLLSRDIAGAEAQLHEVKQLTPNSSQIEMLFGDLFLYKNQPDLAEKAYKIAATYPDISDIALSKLAFCYLIQGKNEDADKTAQQAMNMTTPRVPVLIQMHYYWKYKEDVETAESLIRQALALEPENQSVRWEIAEFYFGVGRYESSQSCMETILLENPKNRSAALFLAEILMARNKFQAAGMLLDRMAAEENQTPGIALLQGKYYLLSNSPIIAAGCFKKAVQLDPGHAIGHYLLGVAYFVDGRWQLARASLTNALKIDPLFTDADLLMADLYYKQAEYDFALIHARRVAEREKANYRARLILGHVYSSQNQFDHAGAAYHAARLLYPDSISALYHSAVVAEKTGQLHSACDLYQRILKEKPGLADVGLRYGRLLAKMGMGEKAIAYFKASAAADPNNGYYHYILGEIYIAAGQPEKARQAFETALSLNPVLNPAYDHLFAFAEKASDDQTLIRLLSECIEKNPTHVEAYLKLAQLYRRQWRWESAIQVLEKGNSRNPESGWLSNALAWTYLEHDQQANKALDLAKSAHERLPEEVSISDTLGWAYYKKGLYQQAIWVLKAALPKDPSNAMVAYHLGLAQEAGGELVEAKENLKLALASNLPSPYKDDATSVLEKMNKPLEKTGEAQWTPPAPSMLESDKATPDINQLLNRGAPESSDIGLEDLKPILPETHGGN